MERTDALLPDPQLSVRPAAPRQGELVAPQEKMALTLDTARTDDRIERALVISCGPVFALAAR